VPGQLFGYGRSDRSSKLTRGLGSETPAGFRPRRGFGHDPAPVSPHNAPFPSYKYACRKLVIRQDWLSNRIFKSFDDIVDHCRYAWNTLTDQPWKIMSIARRDWAAVGAKTIR
jgi:hypothetical protein